MADIVRQEIAALDLDPEYYHEKYMSSVNFLPTYE